MNYGVASLTNRTMDTFLDYSLKLSFYVFMNIELPYFKFSNLMNIQLKQESRGELVRLFQQNIHPLLHNFFCSLFLSR